MSALPATLADVRRLAPELNGVSDENVLAFLEDADNEMHAPAFGSQRSRAHALLAAHMCLLANPDLYAEGELLTSRKVGDLAKSYASTRPDRRGYESTRFGAEYFRLVQGLVVSIQVL